MLHMSKTSKSLCLLLSLILLWFTSIAVRAGIADIRYSAGQYYFKTASQSDDTKSKQDLLNLAYSVMQKALAFDSSNSSYQLQSARISFDLDRLPSSDSRDDSEPGSFYQQGKMHLTKGLQSSPTRADLWAEYAKVLSEKEGATKATLTALDKALKFGPKERPSLMVNAAVTLYFWDQLDSERQSKAWLLVLEAMDDWRLSSEISKVARQTGWEKQLQRSLRDR